MSKERDIKKDCPRIIYDNIRKYKTWILQKYYDRMGEELKRRENPNYRRVR